MSSSLNVGGVQFPSVPLISGNLSRLFDVAGTVVPTTTDVLGEFFAMSLAHVAPDGMVPSNSIVVIPL